MMLGILFSGSFIAAIILTIFLFRMKHVHIIRGLIQITVLVSLWLLVKAVCYFIKIDELAIFLQKAKYISIVSIPTIFFITSHEFVNGKDRLKLLHKLLLFIVPALSLLSILTGGFPYSFISGCKIFYIRGISIFHYTKNVGFYINEIYAFAMMIAACILLILGTIEAPKLFRKQRIFIFLGAVVSFLINILVVTNVFGVMHIDTTPIAILVSVFVCFWVYFYLPKFEIVPASRELVIETTKDMVVILDNNDYVIDVNPAALEFIKVCENNEKKIIKVDRLKGLKLSEVIDYIPSLKTIKGIVNSKGEVTLLYNVGDSSVSFTLNKAPIYDSDKVKVGKMYMLHDTTELRYLAYYDTLTGTGNRVLFYERLGRALIRAKESGKQVALLFMDLDRFKVVNDTLGHAAGDLILVEVAKRIKDVIGETDTISRLGGDEFTIILEEINSSEEVELVAEEIIKEILKPYFVMEREVTLGASIGIALDRNGEDTVEDMVRKADAAMYNAKETGRGKYSFSSEEIEKRNNDLLEMEIKLRRALAKNEFKLYLQPQIVYNEGRFEVVGAEALIRWITAEGKVITPDKFIPVAENNGIILDIGNWVVEEILRLNKILKEKGININLSINVSVRQFDSGGFIEHLKNLLGEEINKDIDLTVEITESMFMHNIEKAIEYLWEIKKLGIGIALDDFGTGFSSLSYIYRLPVDYLKIDRAFISDTQNSYQKNLTSAIISMAKSLNLKTVAEGVETEEQRDRLLKQGCNFLQGYYFSKPVEINEFIKYVKQ